MMKLHENPSLFNEVIARVANSLKINEALIEKDYFVIYLLSELNKEIKGLLFKGGTCCSRAYHAINRFSEDIDLSLDEKYFGRNHNIDANHKVISVCDRLGFKIINKDEVTKHSHGNFNRYYIEYPASYSNSNLKPFIQVEMSFYQKAYPSECKSVNSLLGEWLINNYKNISEEYGVNSFNITTQVLERTFVDKVFAICDYFERKEDSRNSRHIYDLYMISNRIDLTDKSLKELVLSVREDRKKSPKAISAQDGYDINNTLNIITESSFYKNDYQSITMNLLTQPLEYDEAITVLRDIIKLNLF